MMAALYGFFLFCAVAGLACCTAFLALIVVAAIRFRRPRHNSQEMADPPPVSLLKPLCGLEPRLEANLESFFAQDYPRFEIVFGTHNAQDPAIAVARALQARYPQVPVKFVFAGEPDRPNAKVCSLEKMVSVASYDYLVISDSDVCVRANYITEVVRPLADEQVGLVTCLYRGVPASGIWSRLEAIGMSVEMTSGVIVANLLEGMRFALGPTMALRRQVLEAVGGIGALANYHADDYVLGERVFESGRRVVLSSHVIDHFALSRRFRDSVAHQVRWMKSTRFSRPKGHLGTALTFAVPFGLLGLFAGLASGHEILGLCLFGGAVLNRLVMSITAGWGVVRDRLSLRDCWLYPVRDLMGFCFWIASYVGSTVVWRQRCYRLLPGGGMVFVPQPSAAVPAELSQPQTVTGEDAQATVNPAKTKAACAGDSTRNQSPR
ncbi:MAG: bacteriohopanetetrol glucosamine biosynthesis glycosyltransferase HpnI [Candidatus Korobacteraceae bacterium]